MTLLLLRIQSLVLFMVYSHRWIKACFADYVLLIELLFSATFVKNPPRFIKILKSCCLDMASALIASFFEYFALISRV